MTLWYWWILAALFAGVEILAPGAMFIWLAAAAAGTGLMALLAPAFGWEIQALVFAVLAIASVCGWWRYQKTAPAQPVNGLNRRGDSLVGRRVVLAQAIENGRGKARIDDSLWTVSGPELPAGSSVIIQKSDGSVLFVVAADDGV